MRHVGAAISEMFNTGHVQLLRTASRLERLLLAAIHLETSSSGRAECLLLDVWERLRALCLHNCEAQRYDFGSVVERVVDLGAKRLIICDPGGWVGGVGWCEGGWGGRGGGSSSATKMAGGWG